ncbi:MAG: RNase H family protein [Candidatus Thermoplasmatota archaeon]|nr:RNase H family protein [Candidatus Thermoplasmatota archaeon]|tara:strand:- start:228 stop:779 length:552 start_codon:yes stop_codon:yes gene_type:complete
MSDSVPISERISLYFDGSCQDNRNVTKDTLAGWGVVIVKGDSGLGRGDGEIIEEMSGRVLTDSSQDGYLGAEVGSNNTGELSAMAHALRWLLIEDSTDRVTIRGDSQYALNIAVGEWRAKANRELAARVQALWNEVTSLREVEAEHVRAHRGHRWNERADHLAWRACIGENPLPLQFWKPGMR